MANLPFIVKIFSSCFTTNEEDPLIRRRSARTYGRKRQSGTDSSSSFTDSHSVVVASTSTISEEERDSNRVAKGSTLGTRRHLYQMDMRPNQRKRLREESLHLFNTSVTHQEANYFANWTMIDGEEPRRKRHHTSLSDYFSDEKRDMSISGHLITHSGLDKAQANMELLKYLSSAKTKATLALFRRELNYVKSQLNIAQVRCELLQDENRWLRANMQAEEDNLLQCEVEMLLANKSRLALDNAYLTRERDRLFQLVEYLQMGLPSIDSD